MIELGDLAFTQDDFKRGDEWCNPAYAWEIANQLLREKLEKAHQVFGIKDPCELLMVFCAQPREGDTHSARLVCIEKVK